MKRECPICGRPFSMLDIVLAESEVTFQCPHCWSRANATGPAALEMTAATRRPPLLARRRNHQHRHLRLQPRFPRRFPSPTSPPTKAASR